MQNVATVGDGDDGDIEEVDVIPTTKSESGSVKSLTDEKGAESVSGGSTEDVSLMVFYVTFACMEED